MSVEIGPRAETSAPSPEEWQGANGEVLITLLTGSTALVAFVGPNGVIRGVNQRWREAAQGAGEPRALSQVSVGTNYLEVCTRLAAAGDKPAAESGAGLAAVLRREVGFFSLEYPCGDSWFLLYAAPLRVSRGAVVAHIDITERKRSERELALRDKWHQLVLGNSSDLISTHMPDTAFVFSSGACRRMLGYEPEELRGQPVFGFMHPDDLPRADRTFEALLASPDPQMITYRFRRKDGSYLWTESTISVMGRPLGEGREYWVSVTRDVSAHKEAEEQQAQLRRALERAAFEWRATFDAIQSPVLLVGLDGRVQRLNRAARDLVDRDYREIVGRPVEETGSGQPWRTVTALAYRVLDSSRPEVCEATNEGRERTWEVEAGMSAASDETEGKVIVQVRDITKTARLQESLRHSEIMAALGAVVGGVAHEVRNPLFGMSAVLDAFESRFGDLPEHRPYLPLLRTEIGRMTQLMQALLDYGKPARFEMTPREISEVVNGALDLCQAQAERDGVSLVFQPKPDGGPVLLDVHRLSQAFKNVVENAVQHSPAGSEVTIHAAPFLVEDAPWVRFSVRDQGPGFQPEDLSRALEPFFSRRSGGTGLGLSIVSRVVEGHGGRIRIANHPDGGAVVDLEFPCRRSPEERQP